jgi:hypothetical protein
VRGRIACLLTLVLALPSTLFADFQYTETTKMTGGSMMSMMKLAGTFSKQARTIGEPVVHSVYVSGNRMTRNDPDSSEIIDLDKETVTHVNHLKKQYYTITFQQMKEQLLEAQREAAAQPPPKAQPAPTQPPPDANAPQLSFDVAVRNTGAQKQYSGVDTHEAIMTLTVKATDQQSGQSGTLAMTNDLWLTPEIPGYKEVREFYARYGVKLGEVYGSAISSFKMPTMPRQGQQAPPAGSMQGFAEMAKEVSKLKGVPIYTVMRMGTTLDGKPLPAASEAPLPQDQTQNASVGDAAKQGATDSASNSAASAIANKLGGFGSMLGGFGHKKQNDPPPAAANNTSTTSTQPPPNNMVLMETTTEMGGFSNAAIDASHFLPPAGYQQVSVPALHQQQ